MLPIEKCPIPSNTLLEKYTTNGAYADCYRTKIAGQVSFPEFIFAFYTTPLFKLERFILTWIVSKPSKDSQARKLAEGHIDEFAAWRVENRRENELLMCDFRGRTRSWLMVVPSATTNNPVTWLYFGSAVLPIRDSGTGELSLGFVFQALLGFHRIYSILLLASARSRVQGQLSKAG